MVRCILEVSGPEDKEACWRYHMCRRMKSGIDGGINVIKLLWKPHDQDEDWVLLLIDAHNAFNEENWNAMLLAV